MRLLAGHLGYDTALLVLLLTPEAYLPLRNVGAQFHASVEGATAAGRVFEILGTPLPVRPPGTGTGTWSPVPDLRTEAVTLDAVTLAYPGRAQPALSEVSLTISPGEHVLLTGPSGAGKSSLLGLLLRFAEPTAGDITAGGRSLAAIDTEPWRRQIAWVPQHPYLFAGTVAENIALGQPEATTADIAAAARLAGAADFIAALPGGLDSRLGERALNLSAGQRQRIALARAFLRAAPLVLLDEPTAHLDPAAASDLLAVIATLMAGRTVLLVSHADRLPLRPDRVAQLDGGRLRLATAPGAPRSPVGADLSAVSAAPVIAASPARASGDAVTVRGGQLTPGASALRRLLTLARPMRGRLALAVAAGAAATGCAVALLATSGFLLARASEHPSIVAITGAVVAVRGFSVGRGVFRYAERLGSHDVAFRVLADVRVTIYRRLARLAPPAWPHSGQAICSPGSSATSTRCRTCTSAASRRR